MSSLLFFNIIVIGAFDCFGDDYGFGLELVCDLIDWVFPVLFNFSWMQPKIIKPGKNGNCIKALWPAL